MICQKWSFCGCRIQYQDHTAGAQACLYGSQLSHFETSWHWLRNVQDDCFVAGTSWRGQLWEQTYLHYNYNPAISGFGWGPTVCVNIPRIQTWAENMMSQVFAPFLILNWECLGVWRRWKQVSYFQAVLRVWHWKMHQWGCGGQRGFVRAKPHGSTLIKVQF